MRLDFLYTPYATSSRGNTGNIITFAQFEEWNSLAETRDDRESNNTSYDDSTMPPLIGE